MTPFQTFLLGFVVLVIGIAIAAYLLGAPAVWIAVGVVIMLGVGIMIATNRSGPGGPNRPSY